MKTLLIAILMIFAFVDCKSQKTINNKINEVKELNIYGNDANVIIGKVVISDAINPPSIKLLQSFQTPTRQQDGYYFTAFAFGTNNVLPLYNVDLHLKFSHPIDSLGESGISYEFTPGGVQNGLSKDKMSYNHVSTELHAMTNKQAAFVVRIKSKEKIATTISGVDGP